jgi:hypothetical protein
LIKFVCCGTEGGVADAGVMTGVDIGCAVGAIVGAAEGVEMTVAAGAMVADGIGVNAEYIVGEGIGVDTFAESGTEEGTGNGDAPAASTISEVVEFLLTMVVAGAFVTLGAGPYVP